MNSVNCCIGFLQIQKLRPLKLRGAAAKLPDQHDNCPLIQESPPVSSHLASSHFASRAHTTSLNGLNLTSDAVTHRKQQLEEAIDDVTKRQAVFEKHPPQQAANTILVYVKAARMALGPPTLKVRPFAVRPH